LGEVGLGWAGLDGVGAVRYMKNKYKLVTVLKK